MTLFSYFVLILASHALQEKFEICYTSWGVITLYKNWVLLCILVLKPRSQWIEDKEGSFSLSCGRKTPENYSRENRCSQVGTENPIHIEPQAGAEILAQSTSNDSIFVHGHPKLHTVRHYHKIRNGRGPVALRLNECFDDALCKSVSNTEWVNNGTK